MQSHAHLDPRLVPLFLTEAGVEPSAVLEIRAALAALLSAKVPAPLTRDVQFLHHGEKITARTTFEPAWDGLIVTIDSDADFHPLLARFTNLFDAANQAALQSDTLSTLTDLDACLRRTGASIEELRDIVKPITQTVALALIEFHACTISRVVHEEIASLFCKPVREKSVRLLIGNFLLSIFPLPTKRTHRFTLCQALDNVAEPDLAGGLAKLALDPQYATLRGKLCEALARTRHPDAANTIAAVLKSEAGDETRLYAIESLGKLNAAEHTDAIRACLTYQSTDKEWTRVIRKAAEKALKKFK